VTSRSSRAIIVDPDLPPTARPRLGAVTAGVRIRPQADPSLATLLDAEAEQIAGERLFLEHILLVNSAEIIAHLLLSIDLTLLPPAMLLSGDQFATAGLRGCVDPLSGCCSCLGHDGVLHCAEAISADYPSSTVGEEASPYPASMSAEQERTEYRRDLSPVGAWVVIRRAELDMTALGFDVLLHDAVASSTCSLDFAAPALRRNGVAQRDLKTLHANTALQYQRLLVGNDVLEQVDSTIRQLGTAIAQNPGPWKILARDFTVSCTHPRLSLRYQAERLLIRQEGGRLRGQQQATLFER
jgi:hypothetical protein